MDFCCPDPERPVIVPDAETLKHRRRLRYVFQGHIIATVVKILLQGFFAGIFNLFSVWIAYTAWASMFHCTVMFQLIYFCINLLMLMASWGNMMAVADYYYGYFGQALVFSLLVFYIAGTILTYKAYVAFKREYINQIMGGQSDDGYQLFGAQGTLRNMSRYDDPERNNGNRSYLVSGPGVQRGIVRPVSNGGNGPQIQHRSGGWQPFQGSGVRIG
ncbi:hypothetical protein FGO68_gene13699 [Halteria grandinella]|uniref:Uncharacterized protein n=1 Tax=Halteria grandinella TaxID=5974 RepID=A0A8J8SVM4_HALGN|nr:hypothetical protein FGO68_gene13699 [Halteria grandinella]